MSNSRGSRATKTPKVVSDPLYGIIDIRPVLAMIETREFQALGDKRQLGMSYLTFPSATHTRKAHSLGAYQATRELADRWIKRGFITGREGDALAGYALYHDIGHPAFSHVTEDLVPAPKKIKGLSKNSALSLAIIRRLKKEIEACGIDFALLESMAMHRNPLHRAVSDKNLGMEKLDYLERDGLATILSRPVGVDYLRHHIYFVNGALAIDEKAVDNAIEIQNYYLKIYKNVYLRKASAIAQRMMQKMAFGLIRAGELAPEALVDMTDSELLGMMAFSRSAPVREMYSLLRKRDLFREAVVIRPRLFANTEPRSAKSVALLGASAAMMRRLAANPSLQPKNQAALGAWEDTIAELAGIPRGSVLVIPIYGQERFEAQDILIYRGDGGGTSRNKQLASLKSRYPAHFKNIEEVAQTYLAFRVCTTEKYRSRVSSPRIVQKIFRMIGGI